MVHPVPGTHRTQSWVRSPWVPRTLCWSSQGSLWESSPPCAFILQPLFLFLSVQLLLLLTFPCPSHTMPEAMLLITLSKDWFTSGRPQQPRSLSWDTFLFLQFFISFFTRHWKVQIKIKSLSKEIYPTVAWVIIFPWVQLQESDVFLMRDFGIQAAQYPLLFYLFLLPLDISCYFNTDSISKLIIRRIYIASRIMYKLLAVICSG